VRTSRNTSLFLITGIAGCLFVCLFAFRRIGAIDFWWWFSANICILIGFVVLFDREFLPQLVQDIRERTIEKILYGTAAAGFLYALFFAGNILIRSIFPFAGFRVSAIYLLKEGASLWKMVPLMVLVIGPGEELFWRGYVQRRFSQYAGRWNGWFVSVLIYTGIHAGSANYILMSAAFVAGLFWGWLYTWKKSILLNLTSHVLWDIAVFLVFPFTA
jgi:membrane protease YdiL (CAAX protease family)